MPPGFNWFLILVAVVMGVVIVISNVYLLIHYSHPEDRNQAWVPKIIIVAGLTIAVFAVLAYPLDVANTKACSSNLSPSACTYALPMYQLWLALFIAILVLSLVVIPFTLFFYEADSDFTLFQKIKSAGIWTFLMLVIAALVIGIAYGLAGYVVWDVQLLKSGTLPLSVMANFTHSSQYPCILFPTTTSLPSTFPPAPPPAGAISPPPPPPSPPSPPVTTTQANQCIANLANNNDIQTKVYQQRVSLVIYIIAIQSLVGWLLFLVFAGVGMLSAPIDWIQQFIGRPRTTITKSEYMRRGRIIAQRAKECVNMAAMLRRQDKDRRWRSNYKRLDREVCQLEEDEYQLERIYPPGYLSAYNLDFRLDVLCVLVRLPILWCTQPMQGEDGDTLWVLFMIGFYVMLFFGVVGIVVSLAWMAHICLYMLPVTGPVSPMLNAVFVLLDDVFVLLGVIAFASFCLYLMVVAMKGNFLLGLNFFFVKLYPMRPGATMVSSLLVNTAIILTMAPAILQFCAQAFAVYADSTDILDIFGVQIGYLKGISWIYTNNIFLYMLLVVVVISSAVMCFKGPKMYQRKKATDVYLEDD